MSDKEVVSVELDPNYETADANRNNNYFPSRIEPSRLDVFKAKQGKNQMKDDELVVDPDSLKTHPMAKDK